MAWFERDIVDFFVELEANNDRAWFERNKKRYERSVKGPMEIFAGEMIGRMQAVDPGISMTPKEAVFRIYRDVRFSKDKSPYKTNAGLYISSGGKLHAGRPGVYFHVDARTMGIASGYYMLEPNHIQAIRTHISKHLKEFSQLLADPDFKKAFGTVIGEKNKVLPQEFRAAAVEQPLIYNKQFYYWAEFDASESLRDDLADMVMAHVSAAEGMNAFLTAALVA